MSRLLDVLTGLLLIAAIVVGAQWLIDHWMISERDGEVARVDDWERFASGGRVVSGSSDAPVTIVEWGDYECPACRFLHGELGKVLPMLGDSIVLIYRQFPLDQHALGQTATRAAECAATQNRFSEYHTLLYDSSSWLGLGTRAFERFAGEVQMPDSTAFVECLYATGPIPSVEADKAAANEVGLTGTPTLLVNDRLLHSAPDSSDLVDLIREIYREGR